MARFMFIEPFFDYHSLQNFYSELMVRPNDGNFAPIEDLE
jgi:hypothetical protein